MGDKRLSRDKPGLKLSAKERNATDTSWKQLTQEKYGFETMRGKNHKISF